MIPSGCRPLAEGAAADVAGSGAPGVAAAGGAAAAGRESALLVREGGAAAAARAVGGVAAGGVAAAAATHATEGATGVLSVLTLTPSPKL